LPLENASVDGATAAAAFHWFELDRALPELHRVFRPGGRLAIIRNFRDLRQPLQAAVQEIVGGILPDAPEFGRWQAELEASRLFGAVGSFEQSHEQYLDAQTLAERVSTISYVARLPADERAAVLAEVRTLGEAQPETPFPFRYQCNAFVCERRSDD
jgi:ubiquinone/menaquinone biosynthesis C-methylase UbiE